MADPYGSYTTTAPTITYANWGQRVLGYLIDALPPAIVVVIFAEISTTLAIIGALLALGWQIYNRWYLGGTTGQSLGKKALNIRLVGEDTGQPIGMLMAFVRDICHIIDSIICYVGWLFPLWDAKRQTIADKIVRTVVIPA